MSRDNDALQEFTLTQKRLARKVNDSHEIDDNRPLAIESRSLQSGIPQNLRIETEGRFLPARDLVKYRT
jgi:hypothetical protein